VLLAFAGCGSDPSDRRLVREVDALLRGLAVDVRIPGDCVRLPARTIAALHGSPQRIATARARLARLRVPSEYQGATASLDEGLRRIARANEILAAWAERPEDPAAGECEPSLESLRASANDEFQDLAKPHLEAFLSTHNPIAERMGATTWQIGVAGLVPAG
jgi:hypothetical protein